MVTRKKLTEQIINNFHIMKNKMYGKVIAEYKNNITNSQWFVLCIIDEDSAFGIKHISKMLSISSSAATQLVNGLEKKGYVIRATNRQDRRGLNLTLSKQGKKQIMVIRKRHMQMVEDLFKPLSNEDLHQYLKLQIKILEQII